jgi:hypothetical protein
MVGYSYGGRGLSVRGTEALSEWSVIRPEPHESGYTSQLVGSDLSWRGIGASIPGPQMRGTGGTVIVV